MGYNYKQVCPMCQVAFYPGPGLINHLRRQHQLVKTKEEIATFLYDCNVCHAKLPKTAIVEHLKIHGLTLFTNKPKKSSEQPSDDSPLDLIRSAERQIKAGILGLEAEREKLHARIVEIDNLVAKYKKFNGHSS